MYARHHTMYIPSLAVEIDLAGVDKSQVSKLQSIWRVAARLQKKKFYPISVAIRDKFHWHPVEQRLQFNNWLLVYRCLPGNAPFYLLKTDAHCSGGCHWSSILSIIHPWGLGHSRTETLGSRMFSMSGSTFSNSLIPQFAEGVVSWTSSTL